MFSYTAYGLGISSEIKLPILAPSCAEVDVLIRLGKIEKVATDTANPQEFVLWATPQEVCFYWKKRIACLVKNGGEIIVDVESNLDEQTLAHLVVGLPLAILLHQRGMLILHGSAVAANGGVIVFVGQSGQGKSTTAGLLHKRGYPLVTDDILALDLDKPHGAVVLPSYPQLRLWAESAASLGNEPESLPVAYANTEKRALYITDGFQLNPLPLKRIYILTDGTDYQIEPLSTQAAFLEITGQSYPSYELLKAMNQVGRKFQQCTQLANCIPVYRLTRPRSLNALSELAQFLEQDIINVA